MSGRFLKRGQNHEGDDDDDDDDNEEEEEEEEEEEDEHGHHHHHAGHNHGGDDFDDDEDDDDVSSELMGPPQVMAPYSELAVLLDKFLSRRADGWQWSFEVMHELKDWVLRATNDRERNAFEQPTALVFNRNQELADAAAELLKELLRKCEKDEAALHLMGEFVHVLDCLRSEAEVTFEIEEKLLGGMRDYNEPKVPILPEIWHTLDAQAAEIHTLIYDLLQKLMVPRLTSHFSVTQVYVIDGLRNLMTKFIINWTCRAARAPAEIDFKLPLQGFPFAPPNVTDLLSLAPDAQRVAIVFLESFAFCVERDMASVFNKNFDFNSGLEAFGRCFRPAVVALLDNKETDDSTKLFVLRLVDVYPPFMLVDDDLCLPTFSRLFRDSTDPCIVYQASSAIQGLVNFAFDTLQEMEAEVDLGEDNFPEFVDSMFASIAQMRLLSSSASPVDCTNAIVGVTGAVDIFLGLWVTSDRFDLQKASRYFFSRFESLVEDMHQLSKPHAVSFINPSLAQRTALSMTSEELFGPQKRAELPVGGSFTVGTYAFYERVQRLCILVLDAVVINSMVDQMGQVGEVHLRAVQVFSEVCNLLVDEDLFRILTHPKALVLFERHENCLMDRLVNGGHLDNGSLQNLKTIDFFARINQLRWRLCLEHFGTFDLLVNRFPTLSIEHTCDPRKWLQVLHTMQLRDDPTYWQVFLDETKSPTCSPGSLVRMNDLLATSCHTFCGVINFVIRVNSTDETRPVITKAIMEVAKLVQPPEITDPAVRKEVVALMSYTSLEQLVSFHPLKTMLESRDYGTLRFLLQKDSSIGRMYQKALSRQLQRRRAVLAAIEGLLAFHNGTVELLQQLDFCRRDLEVVLVFFVGFMMIETTDEQYHRMNRALGSFCETAGILIQLAQSIMLAEKDARPMAEMLRPLVCSMMFVAESLRKAFKDDPDRREDGPHFELGEILCTFVVDCLKKVSDVELLTDPLLSIARAVRYMVDEGMEVSFFDQMMAGITKLSDAQMQRTQTWQAAATQAVSRVFQDMSSLMKK